MNNNLFTFVFIPVIVVLLMVFAKSIRNKLAKPKYKNDVQKPGKFDRILLIFFIILSVFSALLMILGAVMGEVEMAIVFLVLTLVFSGVSIVLRNAYDMSYQETDEYFILKIKKQEYKVFYENISDWRPGYNEIEILDETKADGEYIRVNITMFKPEILLEKIAEMTFAGKFTRLNHDILEENPKRENEIVNYLMENNYGYLVEDYLEE